MDSNKYSEGINIVPVCTLPWRSMEVHSRGVVKVCCWSKVQVGDVRSNSLAEIWNGPEYQRFRRIMLEGDISQICNVACPWLADGGFVSIKKDRRSFSSDHQKNLEQLNFDIFERRIITKGLPTRLRIFPTDRCNLNCIMCWQNREPDIPLKPSREELHEYLPFLSSLVAIGGEPLLSREFCSFVFEFDPRVFPDCKISMITNGLLLTNPFISQMPDRFSWVGISVDGGNKATYEHVRRGGSWERLIQNLNALSQLPNRNFEISITFTIMQQNHQDIISIYNLAKQMKTRLWIEPVQGDANGIQSYKRSEIRSILDQIDYISALNENIIPPYQLQRVKEFYQVFKVGSPISRLFRMGIKSISGCTIVPKNRWLRR